MAEEGADILAIDICGPVSGVKYVPSTPDDLSHTAEFVIRTGRSVVTAIVDVRDHVALAAAVAEGANQLGGLDVIVANAGISTVARWDDVTVDMWNTMIAVNLTGVWNTVMAGAPHLQRRGGGSVILVSSNCGLKALPFMIPYAAAKFGVRGWHTRSRWSSHSTTSE